MPVQHVLVVDDSKSARLMLRKMLQGFGLNVDIAETAEEALNYLHSKRPDAIFMDHTMPGMDGLTAVRRIHSDPQTAAIPVVMYTSKDEPAYREEAHAAGAVDVLTKPALLDVLGAMLERMSTLADASPPSPAPNPTIAAASPEWVEKIAQDKAEKVFYEAIESQVLPLINDVFAKLRREIEHSQESVATRVCDAKLALWMPPQPEAAPVPSAEALFAQLQPLLEQRLSTVQSNGQAQIAEQVAAMWRDGQAEIAQQIERTAADICKSQLHDLSERLVRQLSAQFAEAAQKLMKSARETAREAAQKTAKEVTLQAITEADMLRADEYSSANSAEATRAAAEAVEQTARRVWAEVQGSLQRRIYLAAGLAAATGIGAALLTYGLLR